MLNRIDEFQHSLCRLGGFFRVRAVRLASFVLLYIVLTGPLVVGECFAQTEPEAGPATITKIVDVVGINGESGHPLAVDVKQQLGPKAVSAFNGTVPVVPTDSQPVTKKTADNYANERAEKCRNDGVISPQSEKIMNVPHAPDPLWLFLSSFMAGIAAGSVIAFFWTWFWYSDFAEWLFEKLYFFKAIDWIEDRFRK